MDPSETTEMEEKTQEIDTGDRISQLPDSVAHNILVLLLNTHPKDLIQMCVLSKTWFDITASFLILNFNLGDYEVICPKIPFDKREDDRYKGVQVFEIDIKHEQYLPPAVPKYCVPKNISTASSSLKCLTVCGCQLPLSLMVDIVKFEHLKQFAPRICSFGGNRLRKLVTDHVNRLG
ncbi:F-box domain containing protein [Tanacetum coccineum]